MRDWDEVRGEILENPNLSALMVRPSNHEGLARTVANPPLLHQTPSMTAPSAMLAIAITAPGGPDVLQPTTIPVPQPGPGEVLIRVAAAGINAPDIAQRRGAYPPPPDASPLPGLEVGGEIVALGDGVSRFAPGDLVIALTNGGGYAEYVAVSAGQVLPVPAGWSMLSAASLPETFFTVQQTLVMRAGLAPDMQVLVHGAAGGIGGAAIQLARLHGANPIGVVSSEAKAAYVLGLGAAAVIRRDREDFVARVDELTGGHGADRIVDIVGGETLDRNITAAARHGHIVLVSTLGGATAQINADPLRSGRRRYGSSHSAAPAGIAAARTADAPPLRRPPLRHRARRLPGRNAPALR